MFIDLVSQSWSDIKMEPLFFHINLSLSLWTLWTCTSCITDSYIRNLSGRIFASHLEEQGALHGNFLHRRSVALSIKQVYQTFKDNTFSRIQTLSHRIACILQPGAQAPIDNLPIDLVTSLTDRDDLVQELTRTFCIARRSA